MQKYVYLLVISFFLLFSGCNERRYTVMEPTEEDKAYQVEIDSILTIYSQHASIYSEIYPKALYGNKEALKRYSDLMLDINVLDNKLNLLINQNRITSNQLKKYMKLRKQFTQ